MAYLQVTNRAKSSLAASILAADTSLSVAAGGGALFPASNFVVTIEDERILVGTRTTDAFTSLTRGYDGTSAAGHASGTVVELRVIAAHVTELQTGKADLASPTFTGTVTIPTPFTLGAVSVLPTGTELNFVDGVTSAIQTQIDGKQASDATLTSIAGLGTAADKMAYTTGVDTWAEGAITAAGRALIAGANAAAQMETLGIINAVYPVGSIYTSVVATNPGTLFGIGTWVAFGAGRVMVGLDTLQTEFDLVEEIGGTKTHTLTIAEMPAHTHLNARSDLSSTSGIDYNIPGDTAGASGSTGGSGAHNNLQPYIVVYMWKRTA